MKVWLDDIRPTPDGYNKSVTTAQEAIKLLKTGEVTYISLDHDLGWALGERLEIIEVPREETGYTVALFIEEGARTGTLSRISWSIHSANPIGVEKMRMALTIADYYCDQHEGEQQ